MATTPLSKLDEYELVNKDQDIRGWKVYDAAGQVLGKVDEMIVDTDKELVTTIRLDNKAEYPVKDIELGDKKILLLSASSLLAGHTGGSATGVDAKEDLRLQVVQERLRVGKRQVDQGGVRVTTTVEEKPAAVPITLREEHVDVVRNKVNRPASASELAGMQDHLVAMFEKAEVPVVAKEARVVEEVVVKREVEQHRETVHDKVRYTDVEVKDLKSDAAPRRAP